MTYHQGHHALAVVDSPLGTASAGVSQAATVSHATANGGAAAVIGDGLAIRIDNFAFTPPELRVAKGRKVVWINNDDVPHLIASADGRFKPSGPLDTGDSYTLILDQPGTYKYFCTLHPRMTGRIVVD